MGTKENLKEAFAGESQANRRYLAYSKTAEIEGYPQIAKLFFAAAEAETVHAMAHLRIMNEVKTTQQNLQTAIESEGFEFQQMYPKFLQQATEENNKPAMETFKNAMAVEKVHHNLYTKALESLKKGNDLPESVFFVCSVCGNTFPNQPPENCPICGAQKKKIRRVA
jgi:rubrerythrin